MSIHPQYTYDRTGNPIGVFLPIEEWNQLTEELHLEIPGWQRQLIDIRLEEYKINPENTLNWDDIMDELKQEDEKI